MAIEINKKKESIRKSLNELLIKLEHEKKIITPSKSYIFNEDKLTHSYVPRNNSELLYITIHLLNGLIEQFHSIEDLNSVKKLRETELYFINNEYLKKFSFPDYKPLIDPILLNRVDVEIQLKKLTEKAKELNARGHKKACGEIMGVVFSVDKSVKHHFQKGENNNFNHMNLALAIIELATPIIEQHLAWEMILLNLSLLIFTLGLAHLGNKIVNNHFLFFKETETSKQLNELGNTVSKLTV